MAEKKKPTGFERMWTCMRKLGCFTKNDLMMLAEVTECSVHVYTWKLSRAGYLKKNRGGGPGVEWRLIKDTGPKAPKLLIATTVYDGNTKESFIIESKKE